MKISETLLLKLRSSVKWIVMAVLGFGLIFYTSCDGGLSTDVEFSEKARAPIQSVAQQASSESADSSSEIPPDPQPNAVAAPEKSSETPDDSVSPQPTPIEPTPVEPKPVETPVCKAGETLKDGKCGPIAVNKCKPGAIQSCQIANGVGIATCSGDGSGFGLCKLSGCNMGFEKSGEACKKVPVCTPSSTRQCDQEIANGSGDQICKADGSGYGACNVVKCDIDYEVSGSGCQKIVPPKPVSQVTVETRTCKFIRGNRDENYSTCSPGKKGYLTGEVTCDRLDFDHSSGTCTAQVVGPASKMKKKTVSYQGENISCTPGSLQKQCGKGILFAVGAQFLYSRDNHGDVYKCSGTCVTPKVQRTVTCESSKGCRPKCEGFLGNASCKADKKNSKKIICSAPCVTEW